MYKALSVGIAAVAAVMILLGSGASPVEAASTVYVTSNGDSGPGTFRDAVDQANYDSGINTIKFLVSGPINLSDDVEYYGDQSLTLFGRLGRTVIQQSTVASTGDVGVACHTSGLFESNGGASITLLNLTFQNADCGSGVAIFVEDDDPPTTVTLNNVLLRDNDDNGLYVYEEDEYCENSDTSIVVNILNSTASGNGGNGVRLREYGDGSLTVSTKLSHFRDNGDDGLLAAEHCAGDLTVTATASSFKDNEENGLRGEESQEGGASATLSAVDASGNGDDGVDFEEDDYYIEAVSVQATDEDSDDENPAAAEGPEVASCDSGGSLTITVTGGRMNGNDSDGFDLDENDCGSFYGTFTAVVASDNDDDGFDIDEEDGGDLEFTSASGTTASNNGYDDSDGNGIQLSEDGWGSVTANIMNSIVRSNGMYDESGDGIDIEEYYYGDLNLNMRLTTVVSNRDDGVDLEEYYCGNLDATLTASMVSLNADDGVEAYQEDCDYDYGEVTLVATSVLGNGGSNIELNGGVIQN